MQTTDSQEDVVEAPEVSRYVWPNEQFDAKRPLRSAQHAPMLVGPRMKGSIPAMLRKLVSTGKPVPFNQAGFDILKATDEEIENEARFPRGITYDFGPFHTGYGGMKLFLERYRSHQANARL